VGLVVSDKMAKSAVVRVERLVKHPRYKKTVRRFSKFKVHDEENRCRLGDWVSIVETRPLSREKCWRVRQILKRERTVGDEG
jgi:small subunit ribosomal protein S17